jgi:hypothetical protein
MKNVEFSIFDSRFGGHVASLGTIGRCRAGWFFESGWCFGTGRLAVCALMFFGCGWRLGSLLFGFF